MAEAAFGPVFEIHGGGIDLVFPHHENELAQSRALGHEFARIWTHNGMLEFGGEKMSKSLGNDVSLRNVLDTWGREVVLLFFMTGHWRKPIDFTDETPRAGEDAVGRLPRVPTASRTASPLRRVAAARARARRRLQHGGGARDPPRLALARLLVPPRRRASAVRARAAAGGRD